MIRQQVTQLYQAAERLRDYPGEYFPALAKAREALRQWRAENPAEAAAEDAAKAAYAAGEQARRKAEYESSFIGRGLD